VPRKPLRKKKFYPEVEGEPALSSAAKELISLAEQFGKNLAEEVDKDFLVGLIHELRRRDIPIVNKVLRGFGFDIDPLVYGALKSNSKIAHMLRKLSLELSPLK